MKDIDVGLKELDRFIQAMNQFQKQVTEQTKALQPVWQKCDESWKGEAKDSFKKAFDKTNKSMFSAIENGNKSLTWLKRFYETVVKFERRRR